MISLKNSRTASFVTVLLIYIAASAVGICTFCALPFDFWLNLLIADVAATVFTFAFSVLLGNASVYDPYWSVAPIVIMIASALTTPLNPSRVLMLIAILFWGIRLTANWAYTFKSLMHQDWRYTMLKEKTGVFYPLINFIGIHMVPTLIVYGCVLPAVFVFEYTVKWNVGSIIFFCVSICAAILQGIADIQMHRFRKAPNATFIRNGLWKHSRHPNYLGEILMWWGIALAAVCVMPNRVWLIAGAIFNTLLFLFVSIPMADKRQSRKSGFDTYRTQNRDSDTKNTAESLIILKN